MFPSYALVAAVNSVLSHQLLPARPYIASDDELVRPLAAALHGNGQFNTHGRGLQILPTEDVRAAVLVAQACDLGFYGLLMSKVGPEFTLRFTATTQTTYDMIVLVRGLLAAERKIGRGTQDEFVARVATHLGVPPGNQSLFNQVLDSLELLKQLGEEVPSYLLEEAVMV